MKTREKWIDSLRFLAVMLVFSVHFIAIFIPGFSRYWHEGKMGIILCGMTGKLAVAMFAVILGYFAAYATEKENFKIAHYICKRYIRFSLVIFCTIIVIQIIIVMLSAFHLGNSRIIEKENFFVMSHLSSLRIILDESLFFVGGKTTIFPLLWCMDDFFYASVIITVIFTVYKNSKKLLGILIVVVLGLCFLGYVWIGLGCMGGIVRLMCKKGVKNRKMLFPLFVFVLILYKYAAWNYKENDMLFIIQGAVCSILFLWIYGYSNIQEKLGCRMLAKGGEISFYIYLSHILVFYTYAYYIGDVLLLHIPFKAAVIVTYISTVIFTFAVANISSKVVERKILPQLYEALEISIKQEGK